MVFSINAIASANTLVDEEFDLDSLSLEATSLKVDFSDFDENDLEATKISFDDGIAAPLIEVSQIIICRVSFA